MDKNEETFVLKILQKDRDECWNLRQSFYDDINGKIVMLINQKRDFFWRIATFAIGLSGALIFISEKVGNIQVDRVYFYISIVSLLLTILFAIVWTRETLDRDLRDLGKLGKKYDDVIFQKITLVDEYSGVDFSGYSVESFIEEYNKRIGELPGVATLKNDVDNAEDIKKNSAKLLPDYSGECAVFLFLNGVAFLIFSLVKFGINYYIAFFVMTLLFSLSFSDWFLKIIEKISIVGQYLNKKELFQKKK